MDDAEFDPVDLGLYAHSGALVVQPPVGAERYFYAASRTTCGARPKVCLGIPLGAHVDVLWFAELSGGSISRRFVAVVGAAVTLRMGAVAVGAVGGEFVGIYIGQQFI